MQLRRRSSNLANPQKHFVLVCLYLLPFVIQMDVWLRHFLVHLRKDGYTVVIVKLGSDAKVSCGTRTPEDGAAV